MSFCFVTVRVVQLHGRVCDPKVVGGDTKCLSNLTFCVLYVDGCTTDTRDLVGLMTIFVARFWRQIVVGAVFIMIYFDVVGSVLLGLSVIFVGCWVAGCLPPLLFFIDFCHVFGSYGVPRIRFSSLRQFADFPLGGKYVNCT